MGNTLVKIPHVIKKLQIQEQSCINVCSGKIVLPRKKLSITTPSVGFYHHYNSNNISYFPKKHKSFGLLKDKITHLKSKIHNLESRKEKKSKICTFSQEKKSHIFCF